MKKKIIIPIVILVALLIAGLVYLAQNLSQQKKKNEDMQQLAEMDKKEMENEYQGFANQYSEMKTQISNDSIVAQLTKEQERTQGLLNELKKVKSDDAREITRLKRELATVRAVLRNYVFEIDSLNSLNQNLVKENSRVKGQYQEATRQIEGLNTEKASLSEKVAIAAQLDAIDINLSLKDKHGKNTKNIKKAKTLQVDFSIAKNVTASNGMRTLYVRVTSPTGTVLGDGGTFNYENRNLECTMKKTVEYGGKQTGVATYWGIDQALVNGTYNVSIFADNEMIGSRSFTIN
ncbi:MAG: hypothetical protein WAR39_03815 [Prevotella sp.]